MTTPPYVFRGRVKDGYLEGNGKLKVLNKTNWYLLPEETKREVNNNSICYNLTRFMQKGVVELVGTFKNGSLHGVAKATLEDSSLSISDFKHGQCHRFLRDWDEKKSDTSRNSL